MSSFAWQMPLLKRFVCEFSPTIIHLDYCQFGEEWQKPTTLLGMHWNMAPLAKRCSNGGRLCSATQRPHVRLTGVDSSGIFMTLRAQPYPWAFAHAVASLVAKAVGIWESEHISF